MNPNKKKELDLWFEKELKKSKYSYVLKKIKCCKNNSNYYEVLFWIYENINKKDFLKLLEHIDNKELCQEYFNLLLYIKNKYNLDNVLLQELIKEDEYNSISLIKDFQRKNIIFNQKPKLFGLSKNGSICVSLVNSNYYSKFLLDDDLSTFTIKIPQLNGNYDLKYFCGQNYYQEKITTKERIDSIITSISNISEKTFFNEVNIFVVDLSSNSTDPLSYYYLSSILAKRIVNSYNIIVVSTLNTTSKDDATLNMLKDKCDLLIDFDLKDFIFNNVLNTNKSNTSTSTITNRNLDLKKCEFINLKIMAKFLEDFHLFYKKHILTRDLTLNKDNSMFKDNNYVQIKNLNNIFDFEYL